MIEKVSTFKDRLNEALSIRDMRPIDLAKSTKISESTISQYRSGYAEPKEERLAAIASALDVNPTWLLGLNVPMEISLATRRRSYFIGLNAVEIDLVNHYRLADGLTKRMVEKILGMEVAYGNGEET